MGEIKIVVGGETVQLSGPGDRPFPVDLVEREVAASRARQRLAGEIIEWRRAPDRWVQVLHGQVVAALGPDEVAGELNALLQALRATQPAPSSRATEPRASGTFVERKPRPTVSAVRWTGDNQDEVLAWLTGHDYTDRKVWGDEKVVAVSNDDGDTVRCAAPGWLVEDQHGMLHAMNDGRFERLYELPPPAAPPDLTEVSDALAWGRLTAAGFSSTTRVVEGDLDVAERLHQEVDRAAAEKAPSTEKQLPYTYSRGALLRMTDDALETHGRMVRGLARAAALYERGEGGATLGGELWDEEARQALALARELGIAPPRCAQCAGKTIELAELLPGQESSSCPACGRRLWSRPVPAEQVARSPGAPRLADLIVEACARVATDVYGVGVGAGVTGFTWDTAGDAIKDTARAAVRAIFDGVTPIQWHTSWYVGMLDAGWSYGPVLDEGAKRHPKMVPYSDLSPEQRVFDDAFAVAVRSTARAIEELDLALSVPVAVFKVPGGIPSEQFEAFKRDWQRQVAGVQNAWKTPIVSSEDVLGGEPVFMGSRLSVRHVGEMVRRGASTEEILKDYPYFKPSDVETAKKFAEGPLQSELLAYIDGLLSSMLQRPDAWGSLESVELQVLLLLAVRAFDLAGKPASQAVVPAFCRFIAVKLGDDATVEPLAAQLAARGRSGEFVAIMEGFVDEQKALFKPMSSVVDAIVHGRASDVAGTTGS